MDRVAIILLFVIPILLLIFMYLLYDWYRFYKSQNKMIDILKNTNNKILNTSKKTAIASHDKNWLAKKLNFAGFENDNAMSIFIVISLTTGVVIGFFIVTIIKSPLAFIASVLIFSLFPYIILVKIIRKREEEFNLFLKEIIDKVTNMMKSGVGFEQGLKKSILTTHSDFTKKVFSIYLNEKDIIGEDKAFEKMFTMVDSKELRIFYLTVSIGRQSGGKFSNTLEKLRKTLHDQGEIKDQITSSTREIKIGSYMIIILVIFIYIMMNSTLNGILNEHFFDSSEGRLQMFFLLVWVSFGLFINNLLTKIK